MPGNSEVFVRKSLEQRFCHLGLTLRVLRDSGFTLLGDSKVPVMLGAAKAFKRSLAVCICSPSESVK